MELSPWARLLIETLDRVKALSVVFGCTVPLRAFFMSKVPAS